MKRRGRTPPEDPGQFKIDWSQAAAVAANNPPAGPVETPASDPRSSYLGLIQSLPWDFVATFPEPLPDAVETGAISEEDTSPDRIRSLHQELARQLDKVLSDQERVNDARRLGVDPKTRAKPDTRAGRERLKQYFQEEPRRLKLNWQALIGVHESIFGSAATAAFDKAVRARHAGVDVIGQGGRNSGSAGTADDIRSGDRPPAAPEPGVDNAAASATDGQPAEPAGANLARRVIARLPVPRPLRHAVEAGVFGHDEQGRPVHPTPDEVREITVAHAEELTELLADLDEAVRRGFNEAGCAPRQERIREALRKYAVDFGDRAGEQLLAYCRRKMLINEGPDEGPARGRR